MKPRALIPAAALQCLLLAACVSLPPPLPVVPIEGEAERIGGFVQRARADAAARQRVRALGQLTLESPSGSGSVREVILAQRPASLRLESLNPLGQTQALLVTDGTRFAFFDGERLERGDVTPGLLRERLGVDLAPGEAVRALLAAPSLAYTPDAAVLGQGLDRIVEMPRQRLRFGPEGDLLEVEVLEGSGAVRWSARYERWRDAGEGRYPFGVTFFFPATALRAELELREVELNPPLDPALFRVPAGGRE